tara:strand:+ start:16522 stop:18339 length:1818 start_codon:yes stop_codon:yes gene_type:complete
MCGIYCHLSKNEQRINETFLKSVMHRRGPNEFKLTRIPEVLGHRNLIMAHSRLSITGVHNALKQPISSNGKHFLFNGEIYNYKKLIRKYDLGDPSQSDTDVFWKLINKIGLSDTLREIDGMYAFVYVSEKSNEIFYGVDHFSQKPLYLYHDEENFVLISEPEYLLCHQINLRLNSNFANDLIQVGYKFRNDFQETEINNLQRVRGDQIFQFKPSDSWDNINRSEIVNREYDPLVFSDRGVNTLQHLIKETIPAEVKFALPLSSGVDSNLLLEIVKNYTRNDNFQGVYTVDSPDHRYSERHYLSDTVKVLRELGIPHYYVNAPDGKAFQDILKSMVRQRLGFVSGLNYIGQYQLYKLMNKHGVKVSLSGVGLDELFTGYYDHYNLYYAMSQEEDFAKSWNLNIKPLVRNHWLHDLELFIKRPEERGHLMENKEDFQKLFKHVAIPPKFDEDKNLSMLRRRLKRELLDEITPNVLRDDDFNSMYHSVESRAPYLLESIHMLSMQYNEDELFAGNIAKSVPRAFGRQLNNTNPAFNRFKKVGFNLSIWDLIKGTEIELLELLHSSHFIRSYLNLDEFLIHFQSKNSSNYFSKMLFSLINIAILEEELH